MSEYTGTDRRLLREEQYRDSANLDARTAIYQYAVRENSLQERAAALIPGGPRGKRVLDVGCGPGSYTEALTGASQVVGVDLSVGMLIESRQRNGGAAALVNGEAEHLPFDDAHFDAVLAMHMLYHVPDRPKAIDELARVVRADGVVLVVTNSQEHQHQTDEVVMAAYTEVTGRRFTRADLHRHRRRHPVVGVLRRGAALGHRCHRPARCVPGHWLGRDRRLQPEMSRELRRRGSRLWLRRRA